MKILLTLFLSFVLVTAAHSTDYPIRFRTVSKIEKGRYGTVDGQINKGGNITGFFIGENLVAITGYTATGVIECLDKDGNVLFRSGRLPTIGLNGAFLTKRDMRKKPFTIDIPPPIFPAVREVRFTAFKNEAKPVDVEKIVKTGAIIATVFGL